MGIYAASKHAIEAYAETLDHEVRAFGVRSILVEPPFTATQLVENRTEVSQRLPAYASVRARILRKFAEDTAHGVRPEAVAEAVLEGHRLRRPACAIPWAKPSRSARLRRFVPERMFDASFRRRFLLDA